MGKAKKAKPGEDVTEEVAEEEKEEVDAPRAKKKKAKKGEPQEDELEAPTPKPKKSKRRQEAEDEAEETEAALAPAKRKKGREQVVEASAVDADGEEPSAKKSKKKGRRRDDAGEEAAEGGQEEPLNPGDDDRPAKKEKKKRRSEEGEAEEVGADEGGKEAGSKTAKKRGGGEGADEASPALEPLTVFVGGIPWSCTSEILRRDFGECGEVTDVNLLMDRLTGKSRGIAYVVFADEAGVEAALKFDGDDYGGRTLKVVRAEASAVRESKIASGAYEVFVRGLPADTSEDSLRTRFSSCGTIARLNLPTRSSGKCKGFAWLTFTSEADMKKAVKLNGTESGESGSAKLLVEAAGEHKSAGGGGAAKGKGKGKGKVSTAREVFVSNLPYEAQEADLRKDFSECGEIERMHMPMRDSKCMGFAWITFTTEESVDRALSYNGDDYGGRRLRVEKSGQHKAGGGKDKGGGKGADD